MNACGEPEEGAFLARISRDAEERERFIDEVVVPESWFFRDQQIFDYLRQQAPAFVQRAYPAPLRVLSVPCAAGESHVPPISTRWCAREISIQRVEPITAPVSHATMANGTSSPRAACAAACSR